MKVLIIGNDRYSQGGYTDLPGVRGDLRLWANRFDANAVDVARNFSLEDIQQIDFGAYDLVIYSGHGVQARREGHLYEGLAFMKGRRLSVLWDAEINTLRNFDTPIWYLDCCHSGGLMDARVAPKWSVSRSLAQRAGVRTLGLVSEDEVENKPKRTRNLAPVPYRVITTAKKHELALEVAVEGDTYGLGTYALHHLLERGDRRVTDEELLGLMIGIGGRGASQPCGNAWEEFHELLTR